MGEWFIIAAPHAKCTLSMAHGLREIFFKNSASELITLLMVPIRPNRRIQKQAAAPSAAKSAPTNPQSGSLDTSPPQSAAVNSQDFSDATAAISSPQITFSALPLEVLELIFHHLGSVVDLTYVGLAMPCLWDVTQHIIERWYATKLGRWAGKNIVSIGNADEGDYPPGLYSASEVAAMNAEGVGMLHNPSGDWTCTYPRRFYPYEVEGVRMMAMEWAIDFYTECAEECRDSGDLGLLEQLNAKRLEICFNGSGLVPMDQTWILRNLTTKEFVTSTGVALDPKLIRGPLIRGIGFDNVIVLRTCWSTTSNNNNIPYSEKVHRGVWAGHRFDITTREWHDEATKDEEWKDVSEEVASEMAAIWEGEYGSGWRDVASRYEY